MSTQRSAAFTDSPHYGKRGPHGRRLCLECGEELSKERARFTFCSDRCRMEREIRCHPAAVRGYLLKRDRGICARCGLDCAALDDALGDFGRTTHGPGDRWWHWRGVSMLAIQWLEAQGFRRADYGWQSTWEAHHKVPVAEGGGGCGLDGYETLCSIRCHKHETRRFHRRRADRRHGRLTLLDDTATLDRKGTPC